MEVFGPMTLCLADCLQVQNQIPDHPGKHIFVFHLLLVEKDRAALCFLSGSSLACHGMTHGKWTGRKGLSKTRCHPAEAA